VQEFSVPPVVTIGEATNLTDPVWDNAAKAPDTAQFSRRTPAGWQDVTCVQFRDEVVALVKGLVAAGIEPGQRVALMSKTRYEWTLIDYAVWTAGAVTVPIYETSSAEQVAWILADSQAVACFVETPAHQDTVTQVRDDIPGLRDVWQLDAGVLDELVAAGSGVDDAEVARRRRLAHADDVATIIYTSGTTGRPKGCVLTHRNMYSDIANAIPGLTALFHEGASTLLFAAGWGTCPT
jgi:long-chain acyl-CoA synthetase